MLTPGWGTGTRGGSPPGVKLCSLPVGAGRYSSWLAAMAPTAPTTSKRRRSTQTAGDVATMAVWQLMQYEA